MRLVASQNKESDREPYILVPPGACSLPALVLPILLLTPLATAQVIIAPKIKGKLVDIVIRDGSIQMPAVVEEGWVTFRITNAGRDTTASVRWAIRRCTAWRSRSRRTAVFLPIRLKKASTPSGARWKATPQMARASP